MRRSIAALAGLGLVALAIPLLAQNNQPIAQDNQTSGQESLMETLARAARLDADSQRSGLIGFVENQISTPDRQIRLNGIEGVLSSNASIAQITVSDTEGIYLVIQDAQLVWNQAALIFGRLEIERLSAQSIIYARNPVPTEEPALELPAPEASGFSVPELPVAVSVGALEVPLVRFGETVFGLESEISLNGAITLEGGALDADLAIVRLDGPGGALDIDVNFVNETQAVDVALTLTEPEDGIVANLLNIEGRPEIAMSLEGSGLLTDLSANLALDADGQRVLSGTGLVANTSAGISVDADLRGPIARILPDAYRAFFGGETALTAEVLIASEGGIMVPDFSLTGGQLALSGTAQTSADGFLNHLEIDATIASADGSPVTLPVPGAATTVGSGRLRVDFGASGAWTGALALDDFTTPDFAAQSIVLDGSGIAINLDTPQTRRITFNADGGVTGISAADPAIAEALGTDIGLGLAGLWEADSPLELAQFRLLGEAIALDIAGQFEGTLFDGAIALATANLAPFSGVAGRALTGEADIAATGTIDLGTAGFDLAISGTATNLTIDEPMADGLLAGPATLSGRLARSGDGLEADQLRLENAQITLLADGTYATGAADFRFEAALADLALLTEDASGRVTATGTAQGTDGNIALNAEIAVPQGRVADRQLADAALRFSGSLVPEGLVGALTGTAGLDGAPITLNSAIDARGETLVLSDLDFTAPGARLTGAVTRNSEGLFAGTLALDAPDVSTAASLALITARGSANAEITLAASGARQDAAITATISNFSAMEARVGAAQIAAQITDLFGVPVIDGTVNGSAIAAAGVDVETLRLAANASGDTTTFDGTARLSGNTDIALNGALSPVDDGFRVALDALSLQQGALSARLAHPTALTVRGDSVGFDGVTLNVGSGRITATGSAGSQLDIAVEVLNLPLSIANTVVPDLGVAGTLSGNATITGAASDPRASFTVRGSGLDAAAITEFGVAPLSVEVQGNFAGGTVTLASARAVGAGGLNASASGTIPLEGSGLNLTVNGSAPLSLANQFVADRGAQISGNATLAATVSGSLARPQFSGRVNVAAGEFFDPELNLRLINIAGAATLSGERAVIESLSANLAGGGSVSVSGAVTLDAALTADIRVSLNSANYTDGSLVAATLSGGLTVTGPMTSGMLVAGTITIERAEITVPDTFGSNAALINVSHRNPPAAVAATLARLRADLNAASGTGSGAPIRLDITINAPNQVFIRGFGLDAELGGSLRITGTADNIVPVGGLELIRGRLEIIGQRIDFQSGTLTLVGDLDPFIDLVAVTQGTDITVFINISGQVSQPTIEFGSTPMLPQDEVLARLLFNRGIGELSPIQLAQLAAVAAQLVGGVGGGPSFLDSIRAAAGLDDLDIVTDAGGQAAVRAGSYIDENIYLSVEGGAGGGRVSIDLDITNNLRARVTTGTDGNSSAGIFYEQDF